MKVMQSPNKLAGPSPGAAAGPVPPQSARIANHVTSKLNPSMAPSSMFWPCYLVAGWLHRKPPNLVVRVSTLSSGGGCLFSNPNVLHHYFLFISFPAYSLFCAGRAFSVMLRWSRKECAWLPLVERVASSLEIKLKIIHFSCILCIPCVMSCVFSLSSFLATVFQQTGINIVGKNYSKDITD